MFFFFLLEVVEADGSTMKLICLGDSRNDLDKKTKVTPKNTSLS